MGKVPRDRRAARIAARQQGSITARQASAAGISAAAAHHRRRTGRWDSVHRGVDRIAGLPVDRTSEVRAALLAVGDDAVASHRTAAAIWELPGIEPHGIEVLVRHGRRSRRPGITVHRTRRLPRSDVTRRGGIAITTPLRTLVDVAAVVDASTLEEALDDALRRRLVRLGPALDRLTNPGRGTPGVAALRAMLGDRAGRGLAESVLETRVRRALGDVLDGAKAQHVVRGASGAPIARVDLAFPSLKLAVEVDGYRFHEGRRRFDADRERHTRLVLAGWQVVYVTEATLRRPGVLRAQIADILRARSPSGDTSYRSAR